MLPKTNFPNRESCLRRGKYDAVRDRTGAAHREAVRRSATREGAGTGATAWRAAMGGDQGPEIGACGSPPLRLSCGGHGPQRPGPRGHPAAARAGAGSARAGVTGALWVLRAPVNGHLTVICSKTLNCAIQTLDTKVVAEILLYKICKGQHRFWRMVWLGTRDEVQDFHGSKHYSSGL
jgi:hypothetical protein